MGMTIFLRVLLLSSMDLKNN